MIQFKEEEVCRMIRAITHYRDEVSGNEYMWDRYNELIDKLYIYGEDTSPEQVSCTSTE